MCARTTPPPLTLLVRRDFDNIPELPEVERARRALESAAKNATITDVQTQQDERVFHNCTHAQFASALLQKKVVNAGRRGKYFYLTLSRPPHPVFHFGMSGSCATRYEPPLHYRRPTKPQLNEQGTDWPPRYWKFSLTLDNGKEWAFMDTRRFGRITLADSASPLDIPPLSLLGADPYLDMPSLEKLSSSVLKRNAPIKAVLLDQNGPICGLGNWMVDEIFFQAKVHPAQISSSLSPSQLEAIHFQIHDITKRAVDVNADSSQFPPTWLFHHRWSKASSSKKSPYFTMENGDTGVISFSTVAGRTSAVVESVQRIVTPIQEPKRKSEKKEKSPSSSPLDDNEDKKVTDTEKHSKKRKKVQQKPARTQASRRVKKE